VEGEKPLHERMSSLICPEVNTQTIPGRVWLCIKNPAYIAAIKTGAKRLDARFLDKTVRRVVPGTTVTFYNWGKTVTCLVTGVKRYQSITKLLEAEGVEGCFPNNSTLASGVRIFEQLNPNAAPHCDVIAFHIQPLAYKPFHQMVK
jgi:ASC-1-like (ASCH) protein